MQYILKKNVLIVKDSNGTLYINGSRNHAYKIEQNDGFYIKLLLLLKEQKSLESLLHEMDDVGFPLEQQDFQNILDDLLDRNIIEIHTEYSGATLLESDLLKYDKQLHFMASMGTSIGEAYVGREKFKLAHAAILGVGGVGGACCLRISCYGDRGIDNN